MTSAALGSGEPNTQRAVAIPPAAAATLPARALDALTQQATASMTAELCAAVSHPGYDRPVVFALFPWSCRAGATVPAPTPTLGDW